MDVLEGCGLAEARDQRARDGRAKFIDVERERAEEHVMSAGLEGAQIVAQEPLEIVFSDLLSRYTLFCAIHQSSICEKRIGYQLK